MTDAFGRSISIPIAKVKIRSQKFGNNVEFESEVGRKIKISLIAFIIKNLVVVRLGY